MSNGDYNDKSVKYWIDFGIFTWWDNHGEDKATIFDIISDSIKSQ